MSFTRYMNQFYTLQEMIDQWIKGVEVADL